MKKHKTTTKHFSQTWGVKVRPSIAREFTYNNKFFDENLAGLHEIRARLAEKNYSFKKAAAKTG
ncbi:hypothetical protein MYX07_02020 [Patescibacteria group bacterium AH-259-L07]|nr:hypothetical protein [Patescibacteria group bacterium AH-259-L07]